MLFHGLYNHQLDDKGRLRMPAKIRSGLGGTFFCLKGYKNTILVYSQEKFAKFCLEYENTSITNVKAQMALTEIISSAFEVTEDAQGRFTLPPILKKYANINKNVVIKGVVDKLEIWSEEAHEARDTDKSLDQLVADIGMEFRV